MEATIFAFVFLNFIFEKMALDPKNMSVEKKALHVPPLEEIADVLNSGLKYNFEEAHVDVVDSPDLTQQPFTLAKEGLNGNPKLIDAGGVPYLVPRTQKKRIYDLKQISKLAETESGFLIGAGAGPFTYVGVNSEGIYNLKVANGTIDQHSRICKINDKNGKYIQERLPNKESTFALLGNFFLSEGKPGKVLKVYAKKRIGPDDFISSIRKTLANHYGMKTVGLGGTFLLKEGKAKQHVMPDFSKTPLDTDEDVNNWLRFYNMSAPLIALGTLITGDLDLDLRVQHFHSFSHHGEAGHYHIDTTPETVEYLGYFNTGKYIYRIDRPTVTHLVGRD